jgi:hypothetical protein
MPDFFVRATLLNTIALGVGEHIHLDHRKQPITYNTHPLFYPASILPFTTTAGPSSFEGNSFLTTHCITFCWG